MKFHNTVILIFHLILLSPIILSANKQYYNNNEISYIIDRYKEQQHITYNQNKNHNIILYPNSNPNKIKEIGDFVNLFFYKILYPPESKTK